MYLLSVKIDYDRGCNSYLIEISRNEKMINLFFTSFFRNICYLKFLLIFSLRNNASVSFSAILSKLFTCKNIIAIYGNNLETTLLS